MQSYGVGEGIIMSFYHILPSNTSPDTFPENHASSYSTPIINPDMLDGEWEVALLSVSHSNCVNTFHHDTLTVTDTSGNLEGVRIPTKVVIPRPPSSVTAADEAEEMMSTMNKLLKNIVTFKMDETKKIYTYQVRSNKFHIYMSSCLCKIFGVTNVLTSYDSKKEGRINDAIRASQQTDCYVIVVPVAATHHTIELKAVNTLCTHMELVKRFKERMTQFTNLSLELNDAGTHVRLRQSNDQCMAVVLSEDFHGVLDSFQNGIIPTWTSFNFKNTFTDTWTIRVYPLDVVDSFSNKHIIHNVTLEPKLFQSTAQLCRFLTDKIGYKDIVMTQKDNVAHLKIKSKDLQLEFSKDVQDILAFDQAIVRGPCHVKGSDVISLSRRINYFYIYSNISEFVRVGDTEAPLLCHFPFNPKPCSIITERVFRQPSYVKVKGTRLSQIDIGIYDDAGKLIPFHRDARTSIRLHFRRR